jgi:membrane protease YdiL (CAAX protease family)
MTSDASDLPQESLERSHDAEAGYSSGRVGPALRGFGPYGLLAIAVIVLIPSPPLKAVAILIWAAWSGTPWREIGYGLPVNWIRSVAIGTALGIALKLLLKAVVMPLLGADPINPAYHYLVGNRAALPSILLAVTVGAGFGEETVFRGYMFERLGKLFGRSVGATIAIVLFSTAVFALAHYPDQGVAGVEQAAMTGLVFGSIFAVTRRLWMVIVAHAVFDLTAVAIIYWNVESQVAHLIFK